MTYHAHIESASQDCDGLYTRDCIMVCGEGRSDESDYDFRNRVLCIVVSTLTFHGGKLEVQNDDEYSLMRYVWSEGTEEGGRHVEATFCNDDCDFGESSYRDHTAEAAGY